VTFSDHFSDRSTEYSQFRPRYPDALFEWIAGHCLHRRMAWDCATGNGQAASGLVAYFEHVIATDASAAQLARAVPHPRIEYRVATAENSGLDDASVDLVTVAQALHWLRLDTFFAEVRRVLIPGGLFAAWGYGASRVTPEIDPVIAHLYAAVVGPFWPPERAMVEEKYQTIVLPFEEVPAPRFGIERMLTLDEYMGYLATWSAVRRYIAAKGEDPLGNVRETLMPLWGPPGEARPVRWSVFVRAGRSI
jgi:ubiquinone/menaquinone biosynthesis C-methylase UbiE